MTVITAPRSLRYSKFISGSRSFLVGKSERILETRREVRERRSERRNAALTKIFGATTIGKEIRARNERRRETERDARDARKRDVAAAEILSRIGDR